jgi:hypothetical protein
VIVKLRGAGSALGVLWGKKFEQFRNIETKRANFAA